MRPKTDFRPAAYVIVALGASFAFVVAVVPFYDAGYRLDLPLLLAGLAPYLVYGVLTAYARGRWLLAAGLLLLAFDLALRIPFRFLGDDGNADGVLYLAPLVAAGALALAIGLGARASDAAPPPPAPPAPAPNEPAPD